MSEKKEQQAEPFEQGEEFDWGEEYYEDEEEQENERTLTDEYLVSIKILGENKTEEIQLDSSCGLRITQISLAQSNLSDSKHVVEMCFGNEFENKFVIARLIPGVVETQLVDVDIPPRARNQTIVFILTGENGKQIGDIDLVATSYSIQHEHSEDEEYSENECGGDCGCCQQKEQCNPEIQKEEQEDLVKTLQQQKEEMMKKKKDTDKPINPFSQKEKQQVDQKQVKAETEKKAEKSEKPEKQQKPEFRQFKGMEIKDEKLGNGPLAVVGRKVLVDYCLRLNNMQGRVIEKSKKKFEFTLGKGEVISGWDLGVAGMKVGGRRILVVPPHLGYGKSGAGKEIPPNSTLCFDITLHNVK